ncbi:hypothetical protein MACJ_000790 [Theileria orientalis]|uniref:Uncharacterized protein n=1 Tax=Theileria orientalis TaxID=68886 RepID=A0A976QUW1_THEOR|nr:hypothetical protein MACJ_000790 [Theileria orientalis]
MRLIYYVLFLFCSLGANLVKAGPTLDLDTYDPEEFNLVLTRRSGFVIEQFSPKPNDEITRVTVSGVELFGSDGSETVSNVEVYSVRSVPQIVEIKLTNARAPLRLRKQGNEYQQIDDTQFVEFLNKMGDGTFTANLGFTLNLESKFTPRNLFKMNEEFVDGVETRVFTPESQPQIKLVKEGPFTVATASSDEHFTKVTVSLNRKRMSLALVESSKIGTPHAYYFHKTSSWKPVDKKEYERLLAALHPVNVYEKVTLDINEPNYQHFQEVRDYDAGLTEMVFNPLPGYELTKVTLGFTELWSSNVNRSSKVVVYSVRNVVKLVKVEVRNAEGQITDVLLSEHEGGFSPVNQAEFSDRVQGLKRSPSGPVTQGHVSGTLDVASPNLGEFQVVTRFFRGVQYKEFSRVDGQSIPKVESLGSVVFEATSNIAVTHVNVFLKEGVPTLYQVSGVVAGSEPFNSLLKLDHGIAVGVDSREFQEFLATAPNPPSVSTQLTLDLAEPAQDHVEVYTSKVYGLDNTVAQAHDGFYFSDISFGDKFVWTHQDHPDVFVNQAVAFRNRAVGDDFKLLELEGFKNGKYVSFYFDVLLGHWRKIDQATFQNKFRLLKFPELSQPEPVQSESKHPADFVLPSVTEAEPVVSTVPEEPVVPTVQETPEEPGWHTAPAAPEEPEWHAAPTVPETPEQPAVPEALEEPSTSTGPESANEMPGQTVPLPESNEHQVVHLDTENLDESTVSMIAGNEEGYYFKSYAPRSRVDIASVHGPNGFNFDGKGARHVTLVKFFWVHTKLVGATLFTVTPVGRIPFVYYYTFKDGKWDYTFSNSRLTELLAKESAYTDDQKADLERMRQHTENIHRALEKLKDQEMKEIENRRKQEEKENKVVMPKKLSHKTRLYDEMADLDQHPPPKAAEVVEETEEQLEKRRHSYAGGDKILVESELLYFELSNPKTNEFVHTKDYVCMGLNSIDVTPFAGRYLHVVSLHGKRVWVSSDKRRATNMQVFYADNQIVGALLKLTSVVRGTTITGEEFDYLFVKDGELQKVNVADFMNLANIRFQSAALVNLTTAPKTQ